jgi:hypothetical protein
MTPSASADCDRPTFDDRFGKLAALAAARAGVLELGCGPARRHADAVTVDALAFEGVDVVGDVFAALATLPDASVDEIYLYLFLQPPTSSQHIALEMAPMLKPGRLLHAVVPHFSNPYYYSDYTHRTPFGLYSFSYLADDVVLRRKVPRYQVDSGLALEDVRLNFKAGPPFYVRYALRRALGAWVNASRWSQEWYEAGWTGWFPCYEIDFRLRKR